MHDAYGIGAALMSRWPDLPEAERSDIIKSLENMVPVCDGLPDWWRSRRNVVLAHPSVALPTIQDHPGIEPPEGAIIILGENVVINSSIIIWGSKPLIYIGSHSHIGSGGSLNCGGESSIIIHGRLNAGWAPNLNARNGGRIYIGQNALWSSQIVIYTDDMHAILDAQTRRRINPFGGQVFVDDHVWLGLQVLLLPGTCIGKDAVVGARSTVNCAIPAGSICVGSPARVVRSGITWSHEDIAGS
ncbi:hypothetical protein [Methylobacterium sp. PvR107]|uniref:acyltransferase n=1 Tax=Methylobacterium sp. PvR107 TaxID=2806597 RepID=UPI001AE10E86|nr:hypothetical protein [Methylobacterium sp. PvR107]MBP1178509.1 acetyltransferase-like isoleucine patch superfamily enzyme [Methylobacterium sp. PvR107]